MSYNSTNTLLQQQQQKWSTHSLLIQNMLKVQTVSHGFPPEPFEYTKSLCVVCAKHSTLHLLKTSWGSVWGIASLLCRSPSSPLLSVCTQDGTFSDLLLEPHKFSRQFTRVPGCHERGPAAVPGPEKNNNNLTILCRRWRLISWYSFSASSLRTQGETRGFPLLWRQGDFALAPYPAARCVSFPPALVPRMHHPSSHHPSGSDFAPEETRGLLRPGCKTSLSLSHTQKHTHTHRFTITEKDLHQLVWPFLFFFYICLNGCFTWADALLVRRASQ